jgi:toxin ParE1/3/4
MVYKVEIMQRAQRDFEAIYLFIQAAASQPARKWYSGFKEALRTLSQNPQPCPVSPESSGVRRLLYSRKPHIYRALFKIDEKKKLVKVLHIHHGSRAAFTSESLNEWNSSTAPCELLLVCWNRRFRLPASLPSVGP